MCDQASIRGPALATAAPVSLAVLLILRSVDVLLLLAVVYPPCTYLEPRGEREEMISVGNGMDELAVKIIEVLPQIA